MIEFITEGYPEKDEQVLITSLKCTYLRKPDCVSDEDDHQELILETRDGGGGPFINIKTNEHGWSIDDPEELVEIINHFKEKIK